MLMLSECVLAHCATHTQSPNYKDSTDSAPRLPVTTNERHRALFECDCQIWAQTYVLLLKLILKFSEPINFGFSLAVSHEPQN